jgi:hypothetical protein
MEQPINPVLSRDEQISLISRKCEDAFLELFDIWFDPQKEAVNVYFAAFRNAFTVTAAQFNAATREDLKEWFVAYLQWGFENDLKEEDEDGEEGSDLDEV